MSKPVRSLSGVSVTIKLAVIVLALAYIGEKVEDYHSVRFAVGSAWHNVMMVFVFWADLLRPGFALCALWSVSDIFANIARGGAFGPAMLKGMRGTGLNLIFGAAGALIMVPLFTYLAGLPAQAVVYGPYIESLTFGLLGVAFYVLARQGRTLTHELAQYV